MPHATLVSHAPAWNFAPDGQPVKPADAPSLRSSFELLSQVSSKESDIAYCTELLTPCRVNAFNVQTCPVPASSDEFLRVWKRQCTKFESRAIFLRKCGAVKLQSLFKVNLPGELLSDILIVLESMLFPAADSAEVVQAEQGCANSQQVLPEAEGLHSGDAQLTFDIMKALSGERAIVQTVASTLLSCADGVCDMYQGQEDLP